MLFVIKCLECLHVVDCYSLQRVIIINMYMYVYMYMYGLLA